MTEDEKRERALIIGRNIDRLMHENRINQTELASKLDMSVSAIGKWLSGQGAPLMGNVQKIANFFGVSISEIVEDQTQIRESRKSSDKSFLLDRIESASAADLRKIRQIMELISDDEQTSR